MEYIPIDGGNAQEYSGSTLDIPDNNLDNSDSGADVDHSAHIGQSTQEDQENVNLELDREKLHIKGIQCTNCSSKSYKCSQRDTGSEFFDLVFTEPPSSPNKIFVHSVRCNSNAQSELDK